MDPDDITGKKGKEKDFKERNQRDQADENNDYEMISPFAHLEKEDTRRRRKKKRSQNDDTKSQTYILLGDDCNGREDVTGKEGGAIRQTKHCASFFNKQRRKRKDEVLSFQIPASVLTHLLSPSTKKEGGGGEGKKKLILHCPSEEQSSLKRKREMEGIPKYSMEVITEEKHDDTKKHNEYLPVTRNNDSKLITQIYHSNSDCYKHVGTTAHHYTIKQQPTPSKPTTSITTNKINLKKVGKKTRESLLKSKLKQKKVLRLDDDDDNDNDDKQAVTTKHKNEQKKASIFASAIRDTAKKQKQQQRKSPPKQKPTTTVTKPKKSTSTSTSTTKTKKAASFLAKNTSITKPFLQLQPQQQPLLLPPKEEKSTLLRLHNLPLQTIQPQQIRKFLSGLSIQRIFILPSHFHFVPILDHDEYENDDLDHVLVKHHHQKRRKERYARVYVKFTSGAAAKLALERNGEMLYLPSSSSSNGVVVVDDDDDDVVGGGVDVYMTPVSKTIASFLSRYMAIDGVKNERLIDTLHNTEKCLPNGVLDTLWMMTKATLKRSSNKQQQQEENIEKTYNSDTYIPTTKQSYQALVQTYNNLWERHEQIELESYNSTTTTNTNTKLVAMHEWDPPSQEHNPVHRLTISASDWLLDEMERIDSRLRVAAEYFLHERRTAKG